MKIELELDPLEFLKSIRSRFVITFNSQIGTAGLDVDVLRPGATIEATAIIDRAIEVVKAGPEINVKKEKENSPWRP